METAVWKRERERKSVTKCEEEEEGKVSIAAPPSETIKFPLRRNALLDGIENGINILSQSRG